MNDQTPIGSHRIVLLIFLAVAVYACYAMVRPFLEPIVMAILIGLLSYPLHERLVTALKGRRAVAAVVSCLALVLILLIPTIALLAAVLNQGINYSIVVREWATQENVQHVMQHPWIEHLQAWLTRVLPEGSLDPESVRGRAVALAGVMGRQFADVSTSILGSVTRFWINFTLLVFVLFFVLRDHDKLIEFLHRAVPLSRTQEEMLFDEVKAVSKSALLGTLLTAVTQGIVGGVGLWLAGFPGLFWGTVMAFASLIPLVGTALVWAPAALFLAFTGEWQWGLFLVVWGVIVVGSIDNFLRPLFMQGASMNTAVVFFSLIGGLQVFGLAGLIYGPLIFAVALVLFKLYESEFSQFLDSQNNS
ncbi:MAG: AI-2E family transporter [Halioglobus sp.]|nr:AI-2E family transporter [Halioglobus sp.]